MGVNRAFPNLFGHAEDFDDIVVTWHPVKKGPPNNPNAGGTAESC